MDKKIEKKHIELPEDEAVTKLKKLAIDGNRKQRRAALSILKKVRK